MIIVLGEDRHQAWLRSLDEQCRRERDHDVVLSAMLSEDLIGEEPDSE